MKVFRVERELIGEIGNYLDKGNVKIISIDGRDGTGKSSLARKIGNSLNINHINLDDFVIKNKGGYVEFIKHEELSDVMNGHIASQSTVIIDGVCVLKILDNLNKVSDLKIYVKRLLAGGYWFDSKYFDYSKSLQEIFEQDQRDLDSFRAIIPPLENEEMKNHDNDEDEYRETLFHEIVRYHFEYKPNLNADIILERID